MSAPLAVDAGVLVPLPLAARLAPLLAAQVAQARRDGVVIAADVLALVELLGRARRAADVARSGDVPQPVPQRAAPATMSVQEAAERLSVGERAVRARCLRGSLDAFRDATGRWRIVLEDTDE